MSEKAMQWRKITEFDTVPRDGSPFAICREGEPDSIECGRYDPYKSFIAYEWSGIDNMHSATHWMPLPPPPEDKSDESPEGKAASEGAHEIIKP